jgi:hypothetical protein
MIEPDYEILRTAAELDRVAEAVASGALPSSVFVIGPAGVGKSSHFLKHLPPRRPDDEGDAGAHWVRGMVSAPALYRELYLNRDRVIVADDCHNLLGDPQMRTLLKQLNESRAVKTVSWNKLNPEMREEGIPTSFETTSRFVMIGNDWKRLDKDLAAVEDRVHLFRYDPTPEELLAYATPWFRDREVLDHAADAVAAGRSGGLSLRLLLKAAEFKSSDIRPWRDYLDARLQPRDEPDMTGDMRAVLDWAGRNGKSSLSAGDLGRSLTRFKGQPGRRDAALMALLDRGLLHRQATPRPTRQGGRPVEVLYGLGPGQPHNLKTQNPPGEVSGLWGFEPGSLQVALDCYAWGME